MQSTKAELLPQIRQWIASEHTYTVRYGIGMLMRLYLDEDFEPQYLEWAAAVQSEEYYVNMMIAWYLATALAKQWEAAIPYLEKRVLSDWVHRKTIQKAVESYRITPEQKVYFEEFERTTIMKRFQKQFLALCISVSLCSTALAGCGNSSEEAVAQTEATTEAQEATETTQEETTQEAEEATTVTDATDIYVEPVEGISDDFIRGMDASAVLVLENSGVKYYNFDGEEQDVFMTLSEAGVNYIRLRVWNDPYDENGNGYGGGNNDLPTAIELGRRATEYGMKVCIDFHYSDFWADPKRQHAPKAWEGMEIDEKCDALYDYTKDSLTQLLEEGVDVEMVQVGNEINNGMAGEYYLPNVTQLLKSGTKAVREIADTYNKDIQIVIHYTNIESNGEIDSLASNLQNNDVDYDIMGLSYYPFWDGSFDNMQRISKYIQKTYNKKVMIAETSYCYTSEDGDGSGNSLVGTDDIVKGYPATVQRVRQLWCVMYVQQPMKPDWKVYSIGKVHGFR